MQQLVASDREMSIALLRLSRHIQILDDGHGRRHLIWTGPVRPGTGQPMLHRWMGHKNVAVHRALWQALYGEEPHGYPRRLSECAYEMCVAPQCFTVATPLEPGNLPESLTRGQRVDAEGQPRANYKVAAESGFSDRYTFMPEAEHTLRSRFCSECMHKDVVPTCPMGHPIERWLTDWTEHIGEQYRCSMCTHHLNLIRNLRSRQPRAGFKPVTAASDRRDREIRDFLDSLPHENTPDEARAAAGVPGYEEFARLDPVERGAVENSVSLDAKFQQDLRDAREHPELFDAETLEYLLSIEPDE